MLSLRKSLAVAIIFAAMTATQISAIPQNHPADFSFRGVDGPAVTAESLRGQVAVLAFGASWLPLTRAQMEGLKKLADQYAKRAIVVYWISTESDSQKSKNFASDDQLRALGQKYKLTVLRDSDGVISKKLGVDQLPSIVLLDKQGNVSGAPIGGMDPEASLAAQLAPRLDKLL